jgi:DNA gyrase/topoisomerase IV subunit B
LPHPVNVAAAEPLIQISPFTRALNLSDSLVLTGIAYIEGKPVATILNKSTKESYVVSDEPNAQGWKLAETSASNKLARTQAKLVVGNETVTIRYSDEPVEAGGPKRPEGENGERPRSSSFSRGSEENKQRYMALSDAAKSKFKDTMHNSREKMMNATPEEREAYVKKMFDKIETDDKNGKFR